MAHAPRLAVLFLVVVFVLVAHRIIDRQPALRKAITSNLWWKAQLFCHPFIVGIFIWVSRASRQEWWAVGLVPYVFNCGVEPGNGLTKRAVFAAFFYMHHIAPLMACFDLTGMQSAASVGRPGRPSAGALMRFSFAQALLFGHCWLLHTIGLLEKSLSRGKQLKQQLFWPYMVLGMFAQLYWFRTAAGLFPPEKWSLVSGEVPLLLWPVLLQYIGRWGLYAYVQRLMGWPRPGHELHDAFETKKQLIEPFTLLNAAIFVTLSNSADHPYYKGSA